MPESSNLSAAIRRQQNRKNLTRYWHTRSFNQLAGRLTAPGSVHAQPNYIVNKVAYSAVAAAFLMIGLYSVWF